MFVIKDLVIEVTYKDMKLYTQSSHLQIKEGIHICEKHHECDVCKKAFSHSNSVQNHKRLV